VVGGGPAGTTCALYAGRAGLDVLLVDRARFPRDKICGDVIPRKGVECLRELGLLDRLERAPHVRAGGVVFSAPDGSVAAVPFAPARAAPDAAPRGYVCYVCRRQVFDDILFQAARERVETRERFRVEDLLVEDGRVRGVAGRDAKGRRVEIAAGVVAGADGYGSIVARRLGLYAHDPDHWAVATRAYYRGVEGMSDAIEIHFVEDILPGYFWIFPLEDGLVNAGLGMLHRELKQRGIGLRRAHVDATRAEFFRDRFAGAELIGEIAGWNLPLGSKQRPVHGDGFLLLGDAAGLVNPFSGEGIGNAMWSGRIAAEAVAAARRETGATAGAPQAYADRLWAELGPSLRLGHSLQRLGRCRPLLNLVIGRAAKNPEVREWIAQMMAGAVSKRSLRSPLTYLRLLFS
jgi:geranylgeranyl reductase family protein